MRIVIVGPGAVGSLFSAFLSKTKQEIMLLDKDKARAQLIQAQGISVNGLTGSWAAKVKVSAEPQDLGPVDLVIICVKSYDTKAAIKFSKPLIGQDTYVLTLQNGVGNIEIISEVVDEDNVIGGVTNQGATLLSPGKIRHAGIGETVIGKMDGKIPVQLRQIRELFNRVGLKTRISRDIKGLIWSKLIINVGINALTAVTRLNNGRLIEFEGTRGILRAAVTEAVRVAKRKRIKLIYDDPLAKVESVCEATSGNISSMLQDVLKKKKTEIDFINGVIVRQAQGLNIPTPINSALCDLVKTMEASYNLQVS